LVKILKLTLNLGSFFILLKFYGFSHSELEEFSFLVRARIPLRLHVPLWLLAYMMICLVVRIDKLFHSFCEMIVTLWATEFPIMVELGQCKAAAGTWRFVGLFWGFLPVVHS